MYTSKVTFRKVISKKNLEMIHKINQSISTLLHHLQNVTAHHTFKDCIQIMYM